MTSQRIESGLYDMFSSKRTTPTAKWQEPTMIAELNMPRESTNPFLSDDGLTIYFDSNRDGQSDLYVAQRASTSSPFGAPVAMTELNAPAVDDRDPWLSPDGNTIVFTSKRGGDTALYTSSR